MTWIEQVWGAMNQGLADFEHNSQVADWEAFAGNVLGNLIWAAAAFYTGGAAFLVSIGGIGLASAATAGATSKTDFFVAARAEHDALNTALKGRVPEVTKAVHDRATSKAWGSNQTFRQLMRRLLKSDFSQTVGGIPTVNSPRIAAYVEQQLHLRSGSTPSKDWAGWEHGRWWVQYEYRVDGAQQPMGRPAPFTEWKLRRQQPDAQLLPIDTDVQNARDRLNAVGAKLGKEQRPSEWPLRKKLQVYFRGSRAITVDLDGNNRVVGSGAWYMSKQDVEQIAKAAGWSDPGAGMVNWVWADSGGQPPAITKLR